MRQTRNGDRAFSSEIWTVFFGFQTMCFLFFFTKLRNGGRGFVYQCVERFWCPILGLLRSLIVSFRVQTRSMGKGSVT